MSTSTTKESRYATAERIARHHLDSERVGVIQFSDIVAAIEAALKDRDDEIDTLRSAVKSALSELRDESVTANRHRMGALGSDAVQAAIAELEAATNTEEGSGK